MWTLIPDLQNYNQCYANDVSLDAQMGFEGILVLRFEDLKR